MTDDALTRKEAEMGRPETLEDARVTMEGCDDSEWASYLEGLIRQHERRALSLESVREEAQIQAETLAQLLGAAILRLKELGETSWKLPPYARALQHAPARVAEGGTAIDLNTPASNLPANFASRRHNLKQPIPWPEAPESLAKEAQARVAELEQDAARYKWFKDQAREEHILRGRKPALKYWVIDAETDAGYESVDAAIDAALKDRA